MPAAGLDSADRYPWRVRVAADGHVRGAGIMLDREYVLTCAHVIADSPDRLPGDLVVYVDCWPDSEPQLAAVTEFKSKDPATQGADVALLKLASPVPGFPRVRLQRTRWSGQRARVFGHPEDIAQGIWVVTG